VESTLLALLGAGAGLLVTLSGGRILRTSLLPDVALDGSLIDARTLWFTAIIALTAGLLAGLAPALSAGRSNLSLALKSGSREGTYQHSRLRSTLLIMQAALSVVLLVGAGLFVRSLTHVHSVRLGYDVEHLALVKPELRGVTLDSAQGRKLYDDIIRSATNMPGVQNATFATGIPFQSQWSEELHVPGIDSVNTLGEFLVQVVSPSYFQTMGTRIVQGRPISTDDRAGAPLAIVVSESMAKKLWPGRSALGQCVRMRADSVPCSFVVGVAEDVKYTSLTNEAGLQYYLPVAQSNGAHGTMLVRLGDAQGGVFVRTAKSAAFSIESLRRSIQQTMPGAAYVTVSPFTETLDEVRRSWEMGATMFTLFGVLALVVASVGLYSVIAYSVAQRTQEIGVRVALGAQRADVLRLVLTDVITSACIAVMLGLSVALLASKWIAPLLFETSAHDPLVYAGVALALLAVALGAGIVPALRASRVNACIALQAD
jgi:putative ABC transport system permease protein